MLKHPVFLHPENNELVKDTLRRLAYAIGGDLGSAEAAHILRLTGTANHKPEYRMNGNPPPIIHVVERSEARYDLQDFFWLPEIPETQPPPPPKPNGKDPNSTRPGDDYAAKRTWRATKGANEPILWLTLFLIEVPFLRTLKPVAPRV